MTSHNLSLNPSFLFGKIEWVYRWSEMRDEKDLTPPTTLYKQMKHFPLPPREMGKLGKQEEM